MITKTLWNRSPFSELERLADDLDRAFEHSNRQPDRASGVFPVDIYEQNETLFVRASVPGISPEELSVSLDKDVLTLRGESKQNWDSGENMKVYRREHHYGEFTRSIRLPEGLQLDSIDAQFENGFVTISIPKVVITQPEVRQITVRRAEPKLNDLADNV